MSEWILKKIVTVTVATEITEKSAFVIIWVYFDLRSFQVGVPSRSVQWYTFFITCMYMYGNCYIFGWLKSLKKWGIIIHIITSV